MDRQVFAKCFAEWIEDLNTTLGLKPIAVDGKSLKGSRAETFTGCVHLVNAWATERGLSLGQVAVEDKSNEITAIPILLKTLDLRSSLVTIDAAGCRKAIVNTIREGEGDYRICVKGNQPKLHECVKNALASAVECEFEGVNFTQQAGSETVHGREEERTVTVRATPADLPPDWRDVKSIVQVNRERLVQGQRTSTTHYDFSSLYGTAEEMGKWIRRHRAIENELHWGLDVTFGEDKNRTRDRNASANLGVVRRTVMSLLKQCQSRRSKKRKAYHAALDTKFLEEILQEPIR